MRTSLNNIKIIDDYLLGRMAPGDALLFEANALLNNNLATNIQHQQHAYAIIKKYGRQNIRAEIAAVQQILANAPQHLGFMQRIAKLFKKH